MSAHTFEDIAFLVNTWREELVATIRANLRPMPKLSNPAPANGWNRAVRELILSPLGPGDQIAAEAESYLRSVS